MAFVILLLAFALRVYSLDTQSIWWDEGHSIQMASAALDQIPTLPGMDVHPPGYFALLHQWMTVAGRSEFALRYLSVVFSILTVALLMRFGRRLAGTRVNRLRAVSAMSAAGLAALSPLYVAYAQEVRMYAMVTFFALAGTFFQWRILKARKMGKSEVGSGGGQQVGSPTLRSSRPPTVEPTREGLLTWYLVGYALSMAASLYTHYFTIFMLLFQNLAWLGWALVVRIGPGRRQRVAVWLGTQVATLILFLPQLPLALRQTVAYANPNLKAPGISEFISRSWLAYTVGTAVEPTVGEWFGWVLAATLALVVLFKIPGALRETRNCQLGTAAFLAGWFLIPLAAYFVVLQRRPSFEPRYMMLVTPALMLVFAWGLTGLPTNGVGTAHRWEWVRGLGTVLALVAFAWGTWSYFTRVEAYKDDSAGLVAWLATETTSQDVVYVDVPHPFHYYADRIPAPTRYLFVDVHTAVDILNAEAAGRERLFWVTWWGSDTDPRGVISFLLDKAGHRVGELDFRGYHVTWWDLDRKARFSLPGHLSPVDFYFGDVVRLDGLAFSDVAQAGELAWATLHFTLLRDTPIDYRVSLRLRSSAGEMLPPTDKDLLNDRHFRSSAWPLDDLRLNQAINVYTLPIPPDTQPGSYCLEAMVYEADTLEALPVVGVPQAVEDGASTCLGTVVIGP